MEILIFVTETHGMVKIQTIEFLPAVLCAKCNYFAVSYETGLLLEPYINNYLYLNQETLCVTNLNRTVTIKLPNAPNLDIFDASTISI